MSVFGNILLGESANISLGETRELLVGTCDLKPMMQDKMLYLVSEGVSIYVAKASEIGKELCEETYAFIPNIRIHYDKVQLDKYYVESYSTLYRICGVLLQELNCDLVMLANGESPEILSINGEIFCDNSDPITIKYVTETLFDEMEIDFTFKKLPRY